MRLLLLAALALASLVAVPAASSHAAYITNTGWTCPYGGATAPVAPYTVYVCYGTPLTWHLVHYSH